MKTLKIILLIVLILGVIAIIGVLVAAISGGFSLPFSNSAATAVLTDERFEADGIETIDIELSSSDVTFCRSEDEDFRVVYSGPKAEEEDPLITIAIQSDKIVVKQRNRIMPTFWGGHREVTIYVPENYSGAVDYNSASGDLKLIEDFRFSGFVYHVASGDFRCMSLIADKVSLDAASGDYFCESIEANEFTLKATSGDMNVKKLSGTGTVKVVSGDIRIDDYSGGGSINSSSGDIKIFLREISADLSMHAISGDVIVTVTQDLSFQLDISVTSGDISTDVSLNNAHVSKRSTTGSIGDNPQNLLEIKVTSGDVRLGH
jgi:lia operon protein LiaG